jgi:hypothetical protein
MVERRGGFASKREEMKELMRRRASVWCLLCFACTIRNPSFLRGRWETQCGLSEERERGGPAQTLDFFSGSKRMVFLLSLNSMIFFGREREIADIFKAKKKSS